MIAPGFDGALGSAGGIPRLYAYDTTGPGILPTGTVDLTQQLHIWKSQLEILWRMNVSWEGEGYQQTISCSSKSKIRFIYYLSNFDRIYIEKKKKITKIVFFSVLVLNDCSAIFLEKK